MWATPFVPQTTIVFLGEEHGLAEPHSASRTSKGQSRVPEKAAVHFSSSQFHAPPAARA